MDELSSRLPREGECTIAEMWRMRFPNVVFYGDCVIKDDVKIGKGTRIGEYVVIGRGSRIGKNVKILYHTIMGAETVIENDVFIGGNCTFVNDKYPPSKDFKPVVIKKGSVIGSHVCLVCCTVGRHSMVGAGSVVTRDVKPHSLIYGNPARFHNRNK